MKLNVIKPRKQDIFDRVKLSDAEKELLELKRDLPRMIEEAVKEAVSKIKIPEAVKETVREIRIEGPRPKEYDSQINELKLFSKNQGGEIESLKQRFESIPFPGGSGVIGIPDPNGKNGKLLTVTKDGAKWADPSVIYLGGQNLEGNWRIYINGNDLEFQRLESGTWTAKLVATA